MYFCRGFCLTYRVRLGLLMKNLLVGVSVADKTQSAIASLVTRLFFLSTAATFLSPSQSLEGDFWYEIIW